MNATFVSIKVDREERPDVDAIYMDAVQALTGRGGWPMTVALDHDGRPFWGGTYFPREQFLQVIDGLDDVWRNRRDDLEQNATALVDGRRSQRRDRAPERRSRPRGGERHAAAAGRRRSTPNGADSGRRPSSRRRSTSSSCCAPT